MPPTRSNHSSLDGGSSNNASGVNGYDNINYPITWSLINGLEMYYLPALVVFGSLGNCLSVYVVFASKMRRTSSSFYLGALAVSDTGFLMSVLTAWLGLINVNVVNMQGFCQFFVYLTYVCSFLSAWCGASCVSFCFYCVCVCVYRILSRRVVDNNN